MTPVEKRCSRTTQYDLVLTQLTFRDPMMGRAPTRGLSRPQAIRFPARVVP